MDGQRITIGIAVYNIDAYVRGCLDSVLAQTYADFDVVIIDDGSTDGSSAIVEEYARRDTRIRVIHQENAGLACARNAMIDACRTEWLWMIDGDDEIEPYAIETWMKGKDDTMEVIVCGTFSGIEEGRLAMLDERQRYTSVKRILCKPPVDEDPYGMRENPWPAVWIRLYNVAFLRENNLRLLPGLRKAQDVLFDFLVHVAARRVALLNRPLYRYLPRENSSITRKLNLNIPSYVLMLLTAMDSAVSELHNADLDEALCNTVLLQVMTAIELCFGNARNEKPYAIRKQEFRAFIANPVIERRLRGVGRIDESIARCVYPFVRTGNLRVAALILRTNRKLRKIARKLLRRGQGQSV